MNTTENTSTRKYVPRVGANVRLRTWSDYSSRNLLEHMWSHFRVLMTGPDFARLQRLNGTVEEGDPIEVPLAAIDPPIGWRPRYTIYVEPAKVEQVLSWFARGIRVKVDHAMDRLGGDAFMPADVDTQPRYYGYEDADIVEAADCPRVFSIVAYVEQEFHMPKDPWLRRQYRKAAERQGWKIWNRDYGAMGYAWFRAKEVPVWDASQAFLGRTAESHNLEAYLTPPLTALDLLSNLGQEHFGTRDDAAEQEALRDGKPIPRWILNRAEYYLQGYAMEYTGAVSETHGGNSTWMFDPSPDAKDPINRKGDK